MKLLRVFLALPLDLLWVFGFRQTATKIAMRLLNRQIERSFNVVVKLNCNADAAHVATVALGRALRESGLSARNAAIQS